MDRVALPLLVLSAAFLLVGCEGNTTLDWRVVNGSSQPLQVSADISPSDMGPRTVTIAPGSEAIVGTSSLGLGAQPDPGNPAANVVGILIIAASGDTAVKNGTASADWVSSSDHRKRLPSHWHHDHRMLVTDVDLEE